jgi:hypothetical protein
MERLELLKLNLASPKLDWHPNKTHYSSYNKLSNTNNMLGWLQRRKQRREERERKIAEAKREEEELRRWRARKLFYELQGLPVPAHVFVAPSPRTTPTPTPAKPADTKPPKSPPKTAIQKATEVEFLPAEIEATTSGCCIALFAGLASACDF